MAINEPKLNVLISSKQKEFAEERADIRAMMAPLPLLVADAAEDWPAQSASIRETFLKAAQNCAIYIGLFGCVYSAPTIEEYRATAANPYRQILVYVKDCVARRDAELAAFLKEVNDPETGRVVVEFRDWAQVRPNFERHMWAAIQRMIGHLLELGNKPVSLSRPGALERKRHAYVQALHEMGLPAEAEQAGQLVNALRRFAPSR